MISQVVSVLIVEDHPVYRDGLVAALAGADGMTVIAAVGTAAEAIDVVRSHGPNVVLMDVGLPDMSGIEATRAILALHPATRVLMLTMSTDESVVLESVRSGACGYLVKGADRDEIIDAVRRIDRGGAVFGVGAAAILLRAFEVVDRSSPPMPELTQRERDVLALVAAGLTNQAIASRLFLSDKTIRNHVSNIFSKLGVHTRREAVALARTAGL